MSRVVCATPIRILRVKQVANATCNPVAIDCPRGEGVDALVAEHAYRVVQTVETVSDMVVRGSELDRPTITEANAALQVENEV